MAVVKFFNVLIVTNYIIDTCANFFSTKPNKNNMKRGAVFMFYSAILILSLYVIYTIVINFIFYFNSSYLIYSKPTEFTQPEIEKVFSVNGEKINTTVLNPNKSDAIMYFGDGDEIVDNKYHSFKEIFTKESVYLIKYRGYGGSTGKPEEQALYADALSIFEKLSKKHNNISAIGSGIGSAIATLLASRKSVHKLVLVSPFDNFKTVSQAKYQVFLLDYMFPQKFNSLARAKKITEDTLIIMAENDKKTLPEVSMKLSTELAGQVDNHIVMGANHYDIMNLSNYSSKIKDYFASDN